MHSTYFDAVTYDGAVYHLDCLPKEIRKLFDDEDGEVSPIFADSEWDGYPICDVCRKKIDYVCLTDLGRKLERPFGKDIRRLLGNDMSKDLPMYAWPGGYSLVYYDKDGEILCWECANKADWGDAEIVSCDVYEEGPHTYCCNCNKILDSEYGDPGEAKYE